MFEYLGMVKQYLSRIDCHIQFGMRSVDNTSTKSIVKIMLLKQ